MGSYPSLGKRGLWDNPAMPETAEAPEHATHSVFNQSTPLENVNLYEIDLPLKEAVRREGAGWAEGRISALGEICGEPDIQLAGRDANGRWYIARSTGVSFVNEYWNSWSPTVTWDNVLPGDFRV